MKKAKFLCTLLQLNWVQVVGTTLLSYMWFTTAIALSPASAADPVVDQTQNNQATTDQTTLENNLPDLQEVVAEKAELGQTAESIVEPKQPQITAQSETPVPMENSSGDVDKLRQDLLIEPLIKPAPVKQTYPPGLSFGAPSAFGAGWGDVFIGASGATAGKARNGEIDGSISTGFGLGDAQKLIGLEFSYNLGSIKNFGENGTFDLKAHRLVYAKGNNQIAVAAGWKTFAQYGNEAIRPSSAYGVVTTYSLLQPNNPVNKMPISLSVGAGGGDFRQGTDSIGVFAGVGVQVHPQVGVGLGWSGIGLNAGVSFVPVPTIPLTINAQGADLTDNTQGGTVFVLSVGYGFNFLPK